MAFLAASTLGPMTVLAVVATRAEELELEELAEWARGWEVVLVEFHNGLMRMLGRECWRLRRPDGRLP